MAKKLVNYEELKEFIPNNGYIENYALLTHYLEMPAGMMKMHWRDELISKYGFSLDKLDAASTFVAKKNVPFKCQENPRFTFIDLFAGIGGFRLAMQACGGQCVFSSEWDEAAKQTYYENYGEVPFGDITKDETKSFIPEKFDILCAGFPCQAFSIAGYQKGFEDVRGTLFFDIADVLEKHHPKAFFLENVKNLMNHDNGRTFSKITDILKNRLGYFIDSKILNPCEYADVPQNRERIFIIGIDPKQIKHTDELIKDGVFHFPFPQKIKLKKTIHDIINDNESSSALFYKTDHMYYQQMKDVIINPDTVYQWRRVYIRENKNGL